MYYVILNSIEANSIVRIEVLGGQNKNDPMIRWKRNITKDLQS